MNTERQTQERNQGRKSDRAIGAKRERDGLIEEMEKIRSKSWKKLVKQQCTIHRMMNTTQPKERTKERETKEI